MTPLISFDRYETAILLGIIAHQTENPSLYYIFNDYMYKIDSDKITTVREQSSKDPEMIGDVEEQHWIHLYIFFLIITGRTSDKWITPVLEYYNIENFAKKSGDLTSIESLKSNINFLLDLHYDSPFLDELKVGWLGKVRSEHMVMLRNIAKQYFHEVFNRG